MAILHTVTFATFFLENNHFVTFYKGSSYFAYYLRTFYGRRADLYVTVGVSKKYTVKFYLVAFLYLFAEIVYIQELVFFSFELLSLNFYNYKHFNLLVYMLLRRVERHSAASASSFTRCGKIKAHKGTTLFFHNQIFITSFSTFLPESFQKVQRLFHSHSLGVL